MYGNQPLMNEWEHIVKKPTENKKKITICISERFEWERSTRVEEYGKGRKILEKNYLAMSFKTLLTLYLRGFSK